MGHFFYGTVVGFLLSFFVLVLIAVQLRLHGRWRIATHVAVALVATFLLALVLRVWSPLPELPWLGKQLLPTKLVQILLGATIGIVVPLWLMRLLLSYYRGGGTERAATPGDRTRGQQAEKKEDGSFAGKEWNWAVGFVAILVVAVLLPYLEDMVRRASSIKLGSVEVTVKAEQRSLPAGIVRDKAVTDYLGVETPDSLGKRIASDNRRYDDDTRRIRKPANDQFEKFYKDLLYPFLNCASTLFNAGWSAEQLKAPIRQLVEEWFLLATYGAGASAPDTKRSIEKMATTARTAVETWARVEPRCRAHRPRVPEITPQVQQSLYFHWFLSRLLVFLDDRFSAIQNLERVRDTYRETELNWALLLAQLYYDEDPTLEKTSEYHDLGLRIASAGLAAAEARASKASIKCPLENDVRELHREICYDVDRYSRAMVNRKNDLAYAHAQAGRSDLTRARKLAQEALTSEVANSKHSLTGNRQYWRYLDTYAFVVMVDSAGHTDADAAKLVACAELVFQALAQEATDALSAVLKTPGRPEFRSEFIQAKYSVEVFSAHRALAGNLLRQMRSAECSPNDEEYRELRKGNP